MTAAALALLRRIFCARGSLNSALPVPVALNPTGREVEVHVNRSADSRTR